MHYTTTEFKLNYSDIKSYYIVSWALMSHLKLWVHCTLHLNVVTDITFKYA